MCACVWDWVKGVCVCVCVCVCVQGVRARGRTLLRLFPAIGEQYCSNVVLEQILNMCGPDNRYGGEMELRLITGSYCL
jgi:hypothetical protein